MIDENEVPS